MTEKKKTISDNSLVKQAYIASGIALLSLGAGTAVNSNNVKADTTETTQNNNTNTNNQVTNNTQTTTTNSVKATSTQNNSNTTNTTENNTQNTTNNSQSNTLVIQSNNTSNTDYSYSGEIKHDVSSNSQAAATNATNVQGATDTNENISYDTNLTNAPASVNNFVNQVGSAAVKVANEYGVYASVMMAQAGLESAWGQSSLSRNAHNLFGVKYRGTG